MKTPYALAVPVAERLAAELERVCTRVTIAGSLRRRRPMVSDIEIVAQPEMVMSGLFGDEQEALVEPVRQVLRTFGELGKNGSRYVEVLDVEGTGLKADVFLVHPPAEWGTILAIRTGPSDLGRWAVTRMKRRGYRTVDGHVETLKGERVPTPNETNFFAAAGLPFLPPHQRDSREARRPTEV